MREDRPLRAVTGEPRLREGRGSVMGPDTSRRTRWWEMTLECGHDVERFVKYERQDPPGRGGRKRGMSDVLDPPKRARCDECSRLGSTPVDPSPQETP